MKKSLSVLLSILLVFTYIFVGNQLVCASAKNEATTTAIAIVFDNSSSMYRNSEKAWCRAIYAMEVFASMTNERDTLLVYPMHPITVDGANGTQYTMQNPYKITEASQASTIRNIYTPKAIGTPIESVDYAAEGLKAEKADKKYLIVLTDGDTFDRNGSEMTTEETKRQLDERFQKYAGTDMTMMYLGIGTNVAMPNTPQSEFFVKKQAKNSEDTLAALTEMCNLIFGRDTLPKNRINNDTINFDISMKKLIVFVQGENLSDLKVTGSSGLVGTQQSVSSTKYGTAGSGNHQPIISDTTLQGMMVTYTDCDAGTYNIEYKGTATNIEVYYEPNADLDFVFTDSAGNDVDFKALYEGDYKVSFGMKDAKTGKLIKSDLLGNPQYRGTYSINDKEYPIKHDGQSGEAPVTLMLDDAFEARLTVTYLSGYTITKDSTDFGWPDGGIRVTARPAGELKLEITEGASQYSLQDLEKGTPYIAKVYYQGTQLTGDALESVALKWNPDLSSAEIKKEFAEDHYKLTLHHKDTANPQNTTCGECNVFIYAYYTAEASDESQAQAPLSYNIVDDAPALQLELYVPEDYIVISDLEESKEIIAKLLFNGATLPPEEFAATSLQVDCGGIQYTVTPNEADSSYIIKLLSTDGIKEGNYEIKAIANYTDHIGRTSQVESASVVTLSVLALWLKWLIGLLILLIIIIVILAIMHIKALPKYAHVNKKDCSVIIDGENVTKNSTINAEIMSKQMVIQSKYGSTKTGLSMNVAAGKGSYIKTPQERRLAEVRSSSVSKFGGAVIREAMIGSVKYVLNEETNKLERSPKSDKPFNLKHGTNIRYSGTLTSAGIKKNFTVNTKLDFKKSKKK